MGERSRKLLMADVSSAVHNILFLPYVSLLIKSIPFYKLRILGTNFSDNLMLILVACQSSLFVTL